MKTLSLIVVMLRYRVAVLLLLFFLLGIATHHGITSFSWAYVWAAIALSASYIVATTTNDIADQKIDAVNHAGHKGRPLVAGTASVGELIVVHVVALCIAVFFAALINTFATILIGISITISYLYSIEPFRLSYRTYLAPVVLSIAYVVLPFLLGLVCTNSTLSDHDGLLLSLFFSLFAGRILLKDFRDRQGDALFGKPTFLLKYGKRGTCLVSFLLILTGHLLLLIGFPFRHPILGAIVSLYFLAIYYAGYLLLRTQKPDLEQVAIGIGAKMGNGLLIALLGLLVLRDYGAGVNEQITLMVSISALYAYSFFVLVKSPENAVIGYKG